MSAGADAFPLSLLSLVPQGVRIASEKAGWGRIGTAGSSSHGSTQYAVRVRIDALGRLVDVEIGIHAALGAIAHP